MRREYIHVEQFKEIVNNVKWLKRERDYWLNMCKDLESDNKDLKFEVHKLETILKAKQEECDKLSESIIKNRVVDDNIEVYDIPPHLLLNGEELIEFYRRHKDLPICCQMMLEDCESTFPFVKNWMGNVIEVSNSPGNRYIVIQTVEKIDNKWTCSRFVYNFDNKTITMDKE